VRHPGDWKGPLTEKWIPEPSVSTYPVIYLFDESMNRTSTCSRVLCTPLFCISGPCKHILSHRPIGTGRTSLAPRSR